MSKLNWIWPCTPGRGGQSITEPLAGCVAALLPTMNSVSFRCLFPLLTPNQSKESILFQGLGVISLLRVYNLASLRALYSAQKSLSRLTAREEEQSGAYLNWQKMSAYLLELTEDVCILWEDSTGLQHCDPESECTAQL